MKNESSEKQLVAKIKSVNNILVTVSRDPSVDQLTAALALTLALNKMGKRSVAVFSGQIPQAIHFLEPEKTFEDNADSLRDFIISLSKDKADRLKVKPDGDFVKVYITPYRTKITPKDLKFSEGDFNIELIVAIGVSNRNELDASIASHGKIFHNATTATLNLTELHDALGMISWQDDKYGCYAEMCYELIGGLGDNGKSLMDSSIATALLTGVVSATDQFRNAVTSPAIMTLSASLMARGANQQLITSELEADREINGPTAVAPAAKDVNLGKRDGSKGDDDGMSFDRNSERLYDHIADPISRRLAEDRDDFGEKKSKEALRAAQGQLLDETGTVDGNNTVEDSSAPVPTEAQPVEKSAYDGVDGANTREENTPVAHEAPEASKLEPVQPAVVAPLPPAPAPTPVAPAPATTSEVQSHYLEDPMSKMSGLPTAADGVTTPVSSGSYVIDGSDERESRLAAPTANSLPFNQPNQVSPVPAPTATPTQNAPASLAMSSSIPVLQPLSEQQMAQQAATMNQPTNTTSSSFSIPTIQPPAAPASMQTINTISQNNSSLPLPPIPPAPTTPTNISTMPPVVPTATTQSIQPMPTSTTASDPGQFVIPS